MSNQGQGEGQGKGKGITIAPAYIGTSIVDAEFKLGYLRKALEDESIQSQRQRKNIEFLIHYYENGGKVPPPGQTMWLLDGKVVDKMPEKISQGSAMWLEVDMHHQLMQSDQTASPVAVQMAQSTCFGLNTQGSMHEIFARFRLPAILGGNPNITFAASIMNDTGSNIQTIFPTDLAALRYDPFTYLGDLGLFAIRTANRDAFRNRVMIEMQIKKADGTAITPWFWQVTVVTPLQPGIQYRLSGNAMRNHLYFATAPGNANLFVAEKKSGITTQLPVM